MPLRAAGELLFQGWPTLTIGRRPLDRGPWYWHSLASRLHVDVLVQLDLWGTIPTGSGEKQCLFF